MWIKPSRESMRKIPGLYKTGDIELQDKLIYIHFYLLDSHWFVAESDGRDTFWGCVILNGNLQNVEWRYFTLWKLDQYNVRGYEVECEPEGLWRVKPALHIPEIAQAHGWDGAKLQSSVLQKGGQYV